MLRTCSCSQIRLCVQLCQRRMFSCSSVLHVVTMLCLPLTWMLHMHLYLFFPLCLGCDFYVLIHLWDLPSCVSPCRAVWGQSFKLQSISYQGDPMDPNVDRQRGLYFLKPSTSQHPINIRECARGFLRNSILAVFSEWQLSGALCVLRALLTEAKGL